MLYFQDFWLCLETLLLTYSLAWTSVSEKQDLSKKDLNFYQSYFVRLSLFIKLTKSIFYRMSFKFAVTCRLISASLKTKPNMCCWNVSLVRWRLRSADGALCAWFSGFAWKHGSLDELRQASDHLRFECSWCFFLTTAQLSCFFFPAQTSRFLLETCRCSLSRSFPTRLLIGQEPSLDCLASLGDNNRGLQNIFYVSFHLEIWIIHLVCSLIGEKMSGLNESFTKVFIFLASIINVERNCFIAEAEFL